MRIKIDHKKNLNDQNIVKVQTENDLEKNRFSVAQKFLRQIDNQLPNIYHRSTR